MHLLPTALPGGSCGSVFCVSTYIFFIILCSPIDVTKPPTYTMSETWAISPISTPRLTLGLSSKNRAADRRCPPKPPQAGGAIVGIERRGPTNCQRVRLSKNDVYEGFPLMAGPSPFRIPHLVRWVWFLSFIRNLNTFILPRVSVKFFVLLRWPAHDRQPTRGN